MDTVASTENAVGTEGRPFLLVARACTGMLVLQLLVSGVLLIVRPALVVTVVRHLGYPDYFPVMLGVAKLLAACAISYPTSRRLAEWAYAGVSFDVVAVVVSHAAMADPLLETLAPLVVLAVIVGSYLGFDQRREEET